MNEILHTLQTTIENAKAEHVFTAAVPSTWIGVDYVLICSALSTIHLKAIYHRLYRACREQHLAVQNPHKSSMRDPDWLYLIASDSNVVVLVHMMLQDTRIKYDIDTLVSAQV
jgi:ribosomal silencing factor RsfS